MNHLNVALSQYGIKEIAGSKDNPEILKYFDSLGYNGTELKDETAWCAASLNWILKTSCKPYTRKLHARSFLNVGEQVEHPQLGDIVVLWRESVKSWKGHVGLYISETEHSIYILGGNQGNTYCIKPYPKSRLLEYRRV
jgi:uncharacterized protein (TIGR02594 family)